MSSPVEVNRENLEKLVKRVVRLLYPPSKTLTPEQVERHWRHLETANLYNPDLLLEDLDELLDELEKSRAQAV